ncbi:hypothetical protein VNO78_21747 [Psophocarpus tetragonolobus]|uniref:Uncharacterized protein n=1 Tax=Psophocarpus tetragonolobus TaxID=3891 RepID=A0AAN9SC49_PSOTE
MKDHGTEREVLLLHEKERNKNCEEQSESKEVEGSVIGGQVSSLTGDGDLNRMGLAEAESFLHSDNMGTVCMKAHDGC